MFQDQRLSRVSLLALSLLAKKKKKTLFSILPLSTPPFLTTLAPNLPSFFTTFAPQEAS